jgi:hypothetical protein
VTLSTFKFLAASAVIAALSIVTLAAPARAVDNQALRASYCLKVMGVYIADRLGDPATQQQMQQTRARLQSFIGGTLAASLYRGTEEDILPILAAGKQGETDSATCYNEAMAGVRACAAQCASTTNICFQSCAARVNTPTCTRTMICLNPTFLPY